MRLSLTYVTVSVILVQIKSRPKGRLREVDPQVGARTVPAGGVTIRSRAARASCLPALRPACEVLRWKWERRRRSDPRRVRRRRPRSLARVAPFRQRLPWAGAVVERRQASAPASGGRRKPLTPWRDPHPLGAGGSTLRLPAFRFLISFVIASAAKQSSRSVPLWIASTYALRASVDSNPP